MMRARGFFPMLFVLLLAAPAGVDDEVWQYSTIAALLAGTYQGGLTVGDIKAHGDLGLGTFNGLDGEMVVLDGKVWQVRTDGRPIEAGDGVGVPFAAVIRFAARSTIEVPAGLDMAGLTALQGRADAAYVSSCDVPFLKPAFVKRLIDLLDDSAICVPRVGDYHHPLAAVYRLDVAAAVPLLLEEDRLRPVFLFEAVPTRVVEAAELVDVDASFQSLRNLNSREDYEAALQEFMGQRLPPRGRA